MTRDRSRGVVGLFGVLYSILGGRVVVYCVGDMSSLLQRMTEARRNFQERKSKGSSGTSSNITPVDIPASPREDSSVHSEHSVASAYSDGIDFNSEDDRLGSPPPPPSPSSSKLSRSMPGSLDFFIKRWSLGSNKLQQERTKPLDIPSDSSPVDSPVASAPQGPGGGWSARKGHVEKAANVTKSFRDVWLTPD